MRGIDKIGEFLEEWPDAEYGPAHIVLSDNNLEDESIDFALDLTGGALGEGCSDENSDLLMKLNHYLDHSPDELRATLKVLRELRAMPEGDRFAGTHLDDEALQDA